MKKLLLLCSVLLGALGAAAQTANDLVDLGLSVLWSGINLGAETETDAGNYYQWGTTTIPESYSLATWPYAMQRTAPNYTGTENDIVTVMLGEDWSTPTKEQWQELKSNCTLEFTEVNGVTGITATSKLNGKSIFLPGCGYMNYNSVAEAGYPYYLSSTHGGQPNSVHVFAYTSIFKRAEIQRIEGYNGYSVRPVCVRPPEPEYGPVTVAINVTDSIEAGAGITGHFSVSCNSGNRPVHKIRLSFARPYYFEYENVGPDSALSETEIICEKLPFTEPTFTFSTADGSDFILAEGDEMTTIFSFDFGAPIYCATGNYSFSLTEVQLFCEDGMVPVKPDTELPLVHTLAVTNNSKFDIETEREVDLGLSVNWSGFYVGAELPEQVGEYLTWGHISRPENDIYDPADYIAPAIDDWAGMPLFDAATAHWGSQWQTPTLEQALELKENTESVPYVYNNQPGYALTSKINGKTIFFAASGFKTVNNFGNVLQTASQAWMLLADRPDPEGSEHYSLYLANGQYNPLRGTSTLGQGMMVRPVIPRPEPIDFQTDRQVDLGLSVDWAGFNHGAQNPAEVGTLIPATDSTPELDWGEGWMLPSEEQALELIQNSEIRPCTTPDTDRIPGFAITSSLNGKIIFIPANTPDGSARLRLANGRVLSLTADSDPAIEFPRLDETVALRPVFNPADAIRSIQAPASDAAPAIYDLQGRRIATPTPGQLLIINNRLTRLPL